MTFLKHDIIYQRISKRGGQIVDNPRHPGLLQRIEKDDPVITAYQKVLDRVAEFGEHLPGWVLTGGLAIPAAIGYFYRKHRAVHLGILASELPKFLITMSAHQYYLFARTQMRTISETTKRDVYVPLMPEEIEKITRLEPLGKSWFGGGEKSENLRLIKVGEDGIVYPHENLLSYFDIYLHDEREEKLISNDDEPREMQGYFTGESYHTIHDRIVPLVNLEYLRLIKKERLLQNRKSLIKNRRERSKADKYDLKQIALYKKQAQILLSAHSNTNR